MVATKTTKKDKKKKPKKAVAPTRTPKLPAILNPANIEKCIKIITLTGNIGKLSDVLGVASPTIYRWRKKFPDFGNAISHALVEHKDLINRNHPEMYVQAISVLKKMLTDRVMTKKTTYSTRIRRIDPESPDMEEVDFWQDKITEEEYTREPNWAAIEKVLGKKELRHAIMGVVTNDNIQSKANIIQQMFGRWMENEELGSNWDGNVFNDIVDMMLIRTLQADTRIAFDRGEITIEEYSKLMAEQSKTFGYILHNRESRAIKLLKGKSYTEIMEMVQAQIQTITNETEIVCNDISIERGDIASEVATRMQKIPEFKRLSAWSELQPPRPTRTKRK